MVMKLNMVDLKGQYDKIREEVNAESKRYWTQPHL